MNWNDLRDDNTVFCSYGRTALYLAFLSIGVKNKKVIIPTFTCQTNVPIAVKYAGGIPLYVDVDKQMRLCVDKIKEKITRDIAAVVVHCYYGSVPDNLEELYNYLKEKNIPFIIDAAHSWGYDLSRYGDIVVYSFSKAFCNPGGGAVVYNNEAYIENAKSIQAKGKRRFHSLCTNASVAIYCNALIDDRCINKKKYSSLFFKRCFSKLIRILGFYKLQRFDVPMDQVRNEMIYDTRMTRWQRIEIVKEMSRQKEYFKEREDKVMKMKKILNLYIDTGNNTWIVVSVKDKLAVRKLKSYGVRTREVWPAFQDYSSEQLTQVVRFFGKHLILVDVDTIDLDQINLVGNILKSVVEDVYVSM